MKPLKDQLNEEQARAFEVMEEPGVNIFLTGEAGTGKSFLINAFVEWERDEKKKNVLLCAPTGTAAQDIGGVTIHRLFGATTNIVKLAHEDVFQKERSEVLAATDIIIIDEISMCRFDLFSYVSQWISYENDNYRRGKKNPIKLIVVGDFYQLPPVLKDEDLPVLKELYDYNFGEGYAFQSKHWDYFVFRNICLKQVVRQKNLEFKLYLNNLRYGINKTETIKWLNDHRAPFAFDEDDSVFLSYSNAHAKSINERKLDALTAPAMHFYSDIFGDVKSEEKFAEDDLVLKIGAKVICMVNNPDDGYCNGTMGIVDHFSNDDDTGEYVVAVRTDNGMVYVKKYQKSVFEYITKEVITEEPLLDEQGKPVFEIKDGISVPVTHQVKKSIIDQEEVGQFSQIPLKLAWAITIHKAQGKTFEKVNIEPWTKNPGQFYTAVSRCRSADKIFFNYHDTTNPRAILPSYIVTSKAVNDKFKKLWDE